MEQPGVALAHRVLVGAEPRQRVLDEVGERLECVPPRHREPERLEVAEPVAEAAAHQVQHLARGLVRLAA